jgi:ankyrin repeat protein
MFLFAALVAGSASAQDVRAQMRAAALKGDLPAVKQLAAKSPGLLKTPKGVGILCMAAFSGNKELVVYLLSQGSKVDERDYDGATPLYHAANGGYKPIVELLLARGAKVNAAKKDGWTPLHAAVASGEKPVVMLLLAHGADINAKAGARKETPFQIAIKYRYDEIAALLQKRMKR